MSFRAVAALALLVFALAAERCGYYAARSVLVLDLVQHRGEAPTQALQLLRLFTFVVYASAFAGGGLAFACGPRITATIGGFVATIGAFALAGGAPPAISCFLIAIGAGVFKGAPYAAAAEILADEDGGSAQGFLPTPRRFASFATFAVLTYGAINLGAFIAPIIAGVFRQTRDTGSFGTTYGFAGAMDLLATILAGVTIFLGSNTAKTMAQQAHAPYRGPDGVAPAAPVAHAPANDVFVPLTLLGVAFAAMHFVLNHAQPDPILLRIPRDSFIHSLNPVVVLLMTIPCGVLFFVLALQRSAVPLTRILGGGLAVLAFGGLLASLALLMSGGTTLAMWTPALILISIGESIAAPIGLTYAALVLRSRAATMVVAGWITLTAMPDYIYGWMPMRERLPYETAFIVVPSTLVVLVGAVLVLAKAVQLHRDLSSHHSNATS